MKSMLDEAADATMQALGQNRLNDTSVKVTQSQVMSSLSGVEERVETQEFAEKYRTIKFNLENFAKKRDNYEYMQSAAKIIEGLNEKLPYTSDMEKYLMLRHGPISVTNKKIMYNATITFQAPKADEVTRTKHMTVVAVFNAGADIMLLDCQLPLLPVQRRATKTLLRKLISEQGYDITLIVIANKLDEYKKLKPIDLTKDGLVKLEGQEYD